MDDLKAYFGEVPGVENVVTYMLGGNVLFDAPLIDGATLVHTIETKLKQKLGYEVDIMLRLLSEMEEIVQNNPLTTIKTEEKNRLYVTFLSEVPAFDVRGSLGVYSNDAEYARVVNREVYIYSNNYGKTCFSNTFIEKKLGVKATTRNWATVNKMLEL
ncbi:DUF1697 domain-containing protein [Nemorincola caseinilytica]|uniref:DUF1697 domain-containing protein n=2 Tax=Nemorincola caseinilytica TaxID=2054315 RepID=A0ABP8NM55_9BACT